MAVVTNGYATLDEFKSWASIGDNEDDLKLIDAINSSSRAIDRFTRRRFYTTTSDETRYYTPQSYWACPTDDIVSITSVAIDASGDRTYATTWASTDYDTLPDNAALDAVPIMGLQLAPNGRYTFYPSIQRSVKIVGKFGMSSSSVYQPTVKQVCLMEALRILKSKDAPYGMAGAILVGAPIQATDLSPKAREMLAPPIQRVINK